MQLAWLLAMFSHVARFSTLEIISVYVDKTIKKAHFHIKSWIAALDLSANFYGKPTQTFTVSCQTLDLMGWPNSVPFSYQQT